MKLVVLYKGQMDRSKLHQEIVQVIGKGKTYRSKRWKGTKEEGKEKASTQGEAPARTAWRNPKTPAMRKEEYRKKHAPAGGAKSGEFDPDKRYQELRRMTAEVDKAHAEIDVKAIYARRPRGKGEPMAIASDADFDIIMTKTRFCMMSAGRNPNHEGDKQLSDEEIAGRTKRLRGELVKRGFVFTPCKGKYGVEEESFMVMIHDSDEKEAMEIGKTFNQESITYTENGRNKLVFTTGDKEGVTDMEGDGYKFAPDADDYYTDIVIGGKVKRFALLVDTIKKALAYLYRIVRRR